MVGGTWSAVAVAAALLAAACTGDSTDSGGPPTDQTSVDETAAGEVGAGEVGAGTDGASGASAPVTLWSIDDALAADPDCSNPVSGPPLKIGYGADFGPLGAQADIPGSEAAAHLAGLINCSGGVDGRPVEVRVVDVGGGPLAGREAVGELIDWDPDAIIGPRLAGPGLRLLQATGSRVSIVFAASSEPALADPSRGSFLVSTDGFAVGRAAARFALDQRWLTAAVVTPPGPDFGFTTSAFTAAFLAGGGVGVIDIEIGSELVTAPSDDGFAAAIAQLALGPAPDLIFASLPPESFAALHRAAIDAGIDSAFLNGDPLALSAAAADPLLVDLEGSYAVSQLRPAADSRLATLDRSFTPETGFGSTNPTAAALVGDAMAVIIEAYLRSDKTGPGAIVQALSQGLVAEGVSGTLRYSGEGSPTKTLHLLQLVDGRAQSVALFEP